MGKGVKWGSLSRRERARIWRLAYVTLPRVQAGRHDAQEGGKLTSYPGNQEPLHTCSGTTASPRHHNGVFLPAPEICLLSPQPCLLTLLYPCLESLYFKCTKDGRFKPQVERGLKSCRSKWPGDQSRPSSILAPTSQQHLLWLLV